jgi:hypothetical protein
MILKQGKDMRTVMKRFSLLLLACCAVNNLFGVVNWGANISGAYLASADPTILIDGAAGTGISTLTGNVVVYADTANMTITPSTAVEAAVPKTIKSNDTYQFRMIADVGNTITLDLTSIDVIFEAGDDAPFLVTFSGEGSLEIILGDGRRLYFQGDAGTPTIGTRFMIGMNDAGSNVVVKRSALTDTLGEIVLANHSMIGFMAPTVGLTETAQMQFQPATTSASGFLTVAMGDSTAFTVSGVDYDVDNDEDITNPANDVTVNFDTPAGLLATVDVDPTQATAGVTGMSSLRIENYNSVYPLLYRNPFADTTPYTGIRPGFVLGSNGALTLQDGTYIDYIGVANNANVAPVRVYPFGKTANQELKKRNASAFIVDGYVFGDLIGDRAPAKIIMSGDSGIFFRSGIAVNGTVVADFTVIPSLRTAEQGEIVFDVEAPLSVYKGDFVGTAIGYNVLNILSRKVSPSGAPIEIGGAAVTYFPAVDNTAVGSQVGYNRACFMVNDAHTEFANVMLRHDDKWHSVNDMNTPEAQPCYVGGESHVLPVSTDPAFTVASERPAMRWFNSDLRFHTSAAFTGVDLFFPNRFEDTLFRPGTGIASSSFMTYYYNGYIVEQALAGATSKNYGRAVIMGTTLGSEAQDGVTVLDRSSYFDVFYTGTLPEAGSIQTVDFVTTANTDQFEPIATDISTIPQFAVQTFFLGHRSNLQVGNSTEVENSPTVTINGDFFSFQTQGGDVGLAELSGTTGEGGIFVDCDGWFRVNTTVPNTNYRVLMGAMVTKSCTGLVTLPSDQVLFAPRVGISNWNVNLASDNVLVDSENLSNYTMDWANVQKDFVGGFVPYSPATPGQSPYVVPQAVVAANLISLPTLDSAFVDQFQVKRSRLGDPFHLLLTNASRVNELVLLNGYDSAEAPVGVLVLEGDSKIGIGNNHADEDSQFGQVKLGLNGLTIVANGSAVVDVLSDIVVDNVAHIVKGPGFLTSDKLVFRSSAEQEIRVMPDGVLNLSSFDASGEEIVIDGQLNVVLEPGATLVMGGATLHFTDQAKLLCEPYQSDEAIVGQSVVDSNDVRIRIVGTGNVLFDSDATWNVPAGTFVGIESIETDVETTNLNITLQDAAQLNIGTDQTFGGALQIGNVTDFGSVAATFTLNGPQARFNIDSQGFFGIGAGIVSKSLAAPSNWAIGRLYNVVSFTFTNTNGTFEHNEIAPTSDQFSSVLAIGPATFCTFTFNAQNGRILGGGNMVRIATATNVAPTVLATTVADANILARGIMAGTAVLQATSKLQASVINPTTLFDFLKSDALNASTIYSPFLNFAPGSDGSAVAGYVYNTGIYRIAIPYLLDVSGHRVHYYNPAFELGAIGSEVQPHAGQTPDHSFDSFVDLSQKLGTAGAQ